MYASACPWRFSKVHGNAFLLHDIQLPGWLGTIGRLAARAHATARHELGTPTASNAASDEVGLTANCADGSGSDRNNDSRRRSSSNSSSATSSMHSCGSSRRGGGASSCRSCSSSTSATAGASCSSSSSSCSNSSSSSSGGGSSGGWLIPGTVGPSPTRGGRRRHRHPAQSDASSWSAVPSSYTSSYSSSSSTSSFSTCSSYFSSPSFCRTTPAAVPAAAAAATVSSTLQAAMVVVEPLTALTAPASGRQLRLPPTGGWAAGIGSSSCVHRQPHAHALRSAPLLVATTRRTILALQSSGDEVERRAREARDCGGAGTAAAAAAAATYASSAAGARSETPSEGLSQSEGSGAGAGAGAGGGGGVDTGSRLLPLRAALRLLYKRVHPDLFHDQPLAKEENERSFKLLQEYVQLARGGDPRSPAARLPYRFAFYLRDAPPTRGPDDPGPYEEDPIERPGAAPATPPLRPPVGGGKPPPPPPLQQPAAGASAGAAASDGGGGGDVASAVPGLHLVRVTLPPPAISPPGSRDLAAPTRKALVKLLAACGLATSGREEEGGEAGAGGEREAEGGPLSLAAFLPEAVEALRQAEAARPSDPAVRVANLRGALRLHHQVMVSFSDKQLPPAAQVALLERLARVVGSEPGLQLQLAGCHIVIGDRMGLDRMGHLCLSAAEPDDAWAALLTGVDLDFVRQQRRSIQGLRSLEAQVARAVGVAQVFTPYGNLTEPSYREFLERLAAEAAAHGPLGGGVFRDVSVCGLPPVLAEPDQPEAPPPCYLDKSTPGVVNVCTDAAAVAVYAGVAQLGGQAQAEVRAARHVEGQLRELADKTRLRLRLRSLTRDPRVAPDHFRAACGLLLDQAAALMPLLEGCTVRIGFVNRLAPDGSCIEIAHNCQL